MAKRNCSVQIKVVRPSRLVQLVHSLRYIAKSLRPAGTGQPDTPVLDIPHSKTLGQEALSKGIHQVKMILRLKAPTVNQNNHRMWPRASGKTQIDELVCAVSVAEPLYTGLQLTRTLGRYVRLK
jgi:hypothetical protein